MIKIIRSAVGSVAGWGLIKELMKEGIEVIGIDSNPLSFGLYLLKKSYVVPRGDQPNFIDEITKIIEKEEINAILSGPELELVTLAKNREKIENKGAMLLCPDLESIEICFDKKKSYDFFKKNGIPTPKLFSLNSIEYPCIIKPRFGSGSTNIYLFKSKAENLVHYHYQNIEKPIIQEFVEGDEYSIDILADRDGNSLSIVPRIRIYTESGISVKGKTVYDSEIINYTEKIVSKLKLFGPSCIQCIKNDESVKFIEINNRFGGGSILSIHADPSIVHNLIKLIKGEKPFPSRTFKQGLIMLRYHNELFITEEKLKYYR